MRSSSNCICFSKTKYKTTERSSLNLKIILLPMRRYSVLCYNLNLELFKEKFRLPIAVNVFYNEIFHFSVRIFPKKKQLKRTADLVSFTEEILNRRLQFLCSVQQ